MKIDDVRRRAFAMPLTNPSYPPEPYRFVDREFFVITYRTDPEAPRAMVPEPLEIAEPIVKYEFIPRADCCGPRVRELVRYYLRDLTVKGAWMAPAALDPHHHALAPVADLPVLEVLSGVHIVTDLTLGLGEVVHDYLKT